MESYDVIVVGAGIMGVSSALYCQKAGMKTLLVEQFSFQHSRGSSHGGTRITRKAYIESDEISKMMKECHELWKELEDESHVKLRWYLFYSFLCSISLLLLNIIVAM